jgi:hypothetical protein
MKKLGILVLASWAFCFILLPQQAGADMRMLGKEEMEKYYFRTWSLRLKADFPAKTASETKTDDLLEETEEDKHDNYVRAKSDSEILSPEPEPKIDQMDVYRRIYPSGHIAIRTGRTLIINELELPDGIRPTASNHLNPTTP